MTLIVAEIKQLAHPLRVMCPGQKKSERNLSCSNFSAASGVSFSAAADAAAPPVG